MQYVDYGNTGIKVSRFGLGCMRLPRDRAEAVNLVRYALDNGVNYLDTAYVYGKSEMVVGEALKDGYRDKAVLVSKNPVWYAKSHTDFEKYLDDQLKRLGVDYIDMYLLHHLNHENWQIVKRHDGLEFLDRMAEKGKIRHKGFSFHGTVSAFKEITDAYGWEMAQIQLNILDEFQQAGVEGLRYASGKGLPVVVMEPLRGGFLINNAPDKVKELVASYQDKRPLVEWCFRWLYNMPEVTAVISGASTLDQLKQSIGIFDKAASNVMSPKDMEFINAVRDAYEENRSIDCTGCRYCMPCPNNVDIPIIFKLYNSSNLMKTHWVDKEMYSFNIAASGTGADRCLECGACVSHCPQGLDIPEKLKDAHKWLLK